MFPSSPITTSGRSQYRSHNEQSSTTTTTTPTRRSYDLYDAEVDVVREKKTQQCLCSMAAVQVICISPLMVLRWVSILSHHHPPHMTTTTTTTHVPLSPLHRLARLVLEENYENSGHFDLTFLMFVWIAFLPTVINPWIYATWVLSRYAGLF